MEASRRLAGRYRLERRIGSSADSEVWEAEDEVLARKVAVKVFLANHRAGEGVPAARLGHPNIVAIYDTGLDGGAPFVVRELLPGPGLRSWLTQSGAVPVATAVAIAEQVADALAAAHAAGITHGRLSLDQILMAGSEHGIPVVKVAGFGTGVAEVADDINQAGAVLYELLVGRPASIGQPVPKPRQLRAGIPRSVESVVLKALAVVPDERFQSAGEFAMALRALDIGPDDAVPAVVREATPPAGVPTFGQAERTWILPAALIVVVAIIVSVVGVVLSRTDVGQSILRPLRSSAAPATVSAAAAHSFDPEASDHEENEASAHLAIDRDPNTAWSTDHYKTRDFGRLKSGVGLRIDLSRLTPVRHIRISSPTTGWSMALYVASSPGDRLSDWGAPARTRDDVFGSVELDIRPTPGTSVLIWITRLGDDGKVEIADVQVQS